MISPQQNFSLSAGQPVAVQVQVADNCGNRVNGALVTARFSNGDATLNLTSVGSGRYEGTWQPKSTGSVSVIMSAFSGPGATLLAGQSPLIQGTVKSSQPVPLINAGVTNAASNITSPVVAPGELITITGQHLASATQSVASPPFPTTLGGTTVLFDAAPAPLQFVSDGQVNLQVPYGLPVNSTHQLVVQVGNTLGVPVPIAVAPGAPGIFTVNQTGTGQGAIQNADGRLSDSSNPAAAGSLVTISFTGGGDRAPDPLNPGSFLNTLVQPITVTIAGVSQVASGTLAASGFDQVQVRVPDQIGKGSVPVLLTVAGVTSQPGVTMAVATAEPPVSVPLFVAPQSLTFQFQLGGPAPRAQSLAVLSVGSAAAFTVSASPASWLSAKATSESTPAGIAVSVDGSNLSPGTYSGNITITSSNTPYVVPVSLSVTAPASGGAQILLSQSNLAFTLVQGGSAAPQTFAILNTGAGLMNFTASLAPGSPSWLSVTPASGSANAGTSLPPFISVSVNGAGLAPGVYRATVQVASADAANSPQSVTVSLTVLPAGSITGPSVLPPSLVFTGAPASTPAAQSVTITNPGTNARNFTSSALTFDGAGWFTYAPASGRVGPSSTGPATISVQTDFSKLAQGVYRGAITFAFDDGSTQSLSLLAIVAPSRACVPTPTGLGISGLSLTEGFTVAAGTAVAVQAQVTDNCGNPITSGSPQFGLVTARFSNDSDLNLVSIGSGLWSATWVPKTVGPVRFYVTAFASAPPTLVGGQTPVISGTISPGGTALSVKPASLPFSVQAGALPASSTLSVTSTGAPLAFTVSTTGSFLSVSASSGTTPASLTVTVDPSKLTAGSYSGSVLLNNSGTIFPVPVQVTVTAPAPKISLPLAPLTFTSVSGGNAPPPQSVPVTAAGGTVNFTTAASTTSGGAWLSVSPATGATDSNLTISANQGTLAAGTYSGRITVTAPAANGGAQQIPVSLVVTPPPTPTNLLADPGAGLQFSYQIGGILPDSQTVNVTSSADSVDFRATVNTGASDGAWLQVAPVSGTTNATLLVSIQPNSLTAGVYTGSILIQATSSNATPVSVPVQLTVTPHSDSKLVTDTAQLTYFAPTGGGLEPKQVTIQGTGPDLLAFNVRATADTGDWLKASRSNATANSAQPATLVITADPTGLAPGTYTGSVVIQNGPDQITIPAAFTVGSSAREIVLSQTALAFPYSQPPQDVAVLATGQGAVNFTAASDAPWLSVSPQTGQVIAGGLQPGYLRLQVNPQSLKPGQYEGHIAVQSSDVDNGRQSIRVTFTYAPDTTAPLVYPVGLTFVATAGGSNPDSRTVTLIYPSSSSYSLGTLPDPDTNPPGTPPWLVASQATQSYDPLNANTAASLYVAPNIANLKPGIYRGIVTLGFPGAIPGSVTVLLVIVAPSSASPNAATTTARQAATCVPTTYFPQFSSLQQNFAVPQGGAATAEMVIVDDCGNVVTSGSVGNTFSSGDRPLTLVPLGDGRWRAVWVPRTDLGATTVNIVATDTAQSIDSGKTPLLRGFITGRIAAPLLNVAQAVVTPDGSPQLAVAPGSWIRIRGSGLADGPIQAPAEPQSQLGSTAVTIGGLFLQLQSVTPTEILALVPSNIPVNTSLPLVVASGGRQSAPEPILVAQSWPVVHSAVVEGGTVVLEISGLGEVKSRQPRHPFKIRIRGAETTVDSVAADPVRPGIYRARVRFPRDVHEGDAIDVVTVTAHTSAARVAR